MDWPSIVGTLSGVTVLCGYLIRRVEVVSKASIVNLKEHTEKGENTLKEYRTRESCDQKMENIQLRIEATMNREFGEIKDLIRNGGRTREGDSK